MSQAGLSDCLQPSFNVSPKLGQWLSSCSPSTKFGNYEKRTIMILLFGVLLIIFPFIAPGKTLADEKGAKLFFGGIGGLCLMGGIFMTLVPVFFKEHKVHLYEGGLCKEGDDKNHEFPWEGIQRVQVREYSSSAGTLCVTVFGASKSHINFDTEFEGDPETIIGALKGKVEDMEYEFVR